MGQEIDALMRAYQGEVPGAAVGVYRAGQPPYCRACGMVDIENRVTATAAANYRLASLTATPLVAPANGGAARHAAASAYPHVRTRGF